MRIRTIEWHGNEMEEVRNTMNSEVTRYVREYETCIEKRTTDSIQRWLIGLNIVKRRAKEYNEGDMRRYFGT